VSAKKDSSFVDASEGRFASPVKVFVSKGVSVSVSIPESVSFSSCSKSFLVGVSEVEVKNPEDIPYGDLYWRDEDGVLVTEEVDVPVPGQPILQRFEVNNV
jgi:hypothetical protein